MTVRLQDRGVRAIVLDIEGTTTPLAFVRDTLFPFARAHLREFLGTHARDDEVRSALGTLAEEWRADAGGRSDLPAWDAAHPLSAAPYLERLMDRDVKSPGLKSIQGRIWESGYRSGELKGAVFPDVPPAFARWRGMPVTIAIYSSGSVLAQRLLFGAAPEGDLTPFVSRFFDTAVGPKTDAASYRRIAGELNAPTGELLFVSDAEVELDAALSAGWQILLSERPGNRAAAGRFERVTSFDEII